MAFTHIGLSVVLYPLTGVALLVLALSFARAQTGWRRGVVGLGVLAGTLHALSVPLTMLLPDTELRRRDEVLRTRPHPDLHVLACGRAIPGAG